MFIIEFIVNYWKKKYHSETPQELPNLEAQPYPEIEDYEKCEHVFMPIDSTGEILSCAKCGMIIKRSELKKKNFFEK